MKLVELSRTKKGDTPERHN